MAQDFSLRWDIDSLNTAYRQGYMAGVMGAEKTSCPFNSEMQEAAWEGGWEDGYEHCELAQPVNKLAS